MNFYEDPLVFDFLWKTTQELLDQVEIKKQVLAKDQNGNNTFSVAASKSGFRLLTFLNWLKTNFSSELRKVFEDKNYNNQTLIHVVAVKRNRHCCQDFVDFVLVSFQKTEIQKMLLEKDKEGKIPFEASRRNNHSAAVRIFEKFHKSHFSAALLQLET